MNIDIVKIDYSNAQHKNQLLFLLNQYAKDPMGGGEELSQYTMDHLANELAKVPLAFSLIAYVDDEPAGLVNCFGGFSTFACKPLVNIHDVVVLEQYRGLGLSQMMLEKVEEIAVAKGCCKITLEVLSGNIGAKSAYAKFGFSDYKLDEDGGIALFWQKKLGQ